MKPLLDLHHTYAKRFPIVRERTHLYMASHLFCVLALPFYTLLSTQAGGNTGPGWHAIHTNSAFTRPALTDSNA